MECILKLMTWKVLYDEDLFVATKMLFMEKPMKKSAPLDMELCCLLNAFVKDRGKAENCIAKGRMVDTENGIYIGEWNFGQKYGKGTMTYWNGNKDDGEIVCSFLPWLRVLDKENVELLPGFTYFHLKLKGNEAEDITQNLEEALEFIEQAVSHFQRVLVHCYMGISRSAAVVIAYLMKYTESNFDFAYEKVKSKRLCINPNKGFIKQLKALKFN